MRAQQGSTAAWTIGMARSAQRRSPIARLAEGRRAVSASAPDKSIGVSSIDPPWPVDYRVLSLGRGSSIEYWVRPAEYRVFCVLPPAVSPRASAAVKEAACSERLLKGIEYTVKITF